MVAKRVGYAASVSTDQCSKYVVEGHSMPVNRRYGISSPRSYSAGFIVGSIGDNAVSKAMEPEKIGRMPLAVMLLLILNLYQGGSWCIKSAVRTMPFVIALFKELKELPLTGVILKINLLSTESMEELV
ncbi:hypothetical protein [Anaplasma bovis]|uniref:hypothetical protein n=1 Tax=Anaplasma bovis TaxID=186733 RepID=UPI002FEF24E6